MKVTNNKYIELSTTLRNLMRQCILLQSLDEASFDTVVQTSKAVQLAENKRLFDQGDKLTDIYLLISGGIKLQRLAMNGDEKVLEIIRPGQTFAEAVLFSGGSKYPVSAVTVSPSLLISIDAENYLQLLNNSTALSLNLLAKLSQKLHWMVNEVDRLSLHNATFRVIDYLLNNIHSDNSERPSVQLIAAKHVIASRLSIKPETFSRTLKNLAKQNLIILDGSQIELVNIDKLRQLISLAE